MSSEDGTRGLTSLLDQINGGNAGAFGRLVDAVYDDLKRIAANQMAKGLVEPVAALTLQPTAIANDAIMDLYRQRAQWRNSDQFFAIATRLIQRQISDYRKRRRAQKRGGGKRGVPLELHPNAANLPAPDAQPDVDAPVIDALERLHAEYPRKAEVVTLHVLCARPLPKVAEMVGVALATAERDWAFAKQWLARELAAEASA